MERINFSIQQYGNVLECVEAYRLEYVFTVCSTLYRTIITDREIHCFINCIEIDNNTEKYVNKFYGTI